MVNRNRMLKASVPAELREWVDNRRINAHLRVVWPMVLGTMLNAVVIAAVLWREIAHSTLIGFVLFVAIALVGRVHMAGGVSRAMRRENTRKLIGGMIGNSLIVASAFSLALAVWLPVVSPSAQLLLVISGLSQIAAASYIVRTLPKSAGGMIIVLTIGLGWGIARIGQPAALGALVLLVSGSILQLRMVLTANNSFVSRILHDRELAATARTVKLLLNEYQESSADWLFELDGEGRLHKVSSRFVKASGIPRDKLEGVKFASLFAADKGHEALSKAIAGRQPIRGAVLALAGAGEGQRWWSVSGRPCFVSEAEGVMFRGVISDVSEQRLAEHRVHHMAHFDALTGLPNRALFNQTLTELLDSDEDDTHAALLLIDIDHFKAVNDMYGHPAGDAFLRELGGRLLRTVEASGLGGEQRLVARLSGDEFAIVITGEDCCDHAVRLSELLLKAAHEPMMIEGHELSSAISIGIALAPQHAAIKQQLMSNADIALYAAKNGGRGIWEMFEPGMDAALHERHTLARDLRHAVAKGQLRLYIQPLVDVETEAMTGYEALLRWQHPERGLIAPDNFIPLAEETGLIVPIGEWVIRTAFAEAARWAGGETIAINLSPIQLSSPNLLPTIVNALAENGLDPGRVEFEITEGVLLHNSEANIEVLNRLHSFGVKIALDDFGTGYASLNYLLTFPFDKIKIDKRFISDLMIREESQAIVSAVIGLANELGMCTLAEGVEEPAQLTHLREHGCRMVQGWLFGKALPSEDYHPRAEPELVGSSVVTVDPKAEAKPRRRKAA